MKKRIILAFISHVHTFNHRYLLLLLLHGKLEIKVVSVGKSYLGVPYRYGGTTRQDLIVPDIQATYLKMLEYNYQERLPYNIM